MTRTAKGARQGEGKLTDDQWARAALAILAVGMIVGALLTT